ncbi:MAG: hypothetical protein JSW62_03595 [Thermoplasmatales archaeon]|nr:MAG: hypothetical protein JSW62_03595 [Thermoplasmatales archaeon]
MKKKMLIIGVFAVLLMLSMPMVSNIQAQSATIPAEDDNDCSICANPLPFRPVCSYVRLYVAALNLAIRLELFGPEDGSLVSDLAYGTIRDVRDAFIRFMEDIDCPDIPDPV